MDRILRKRSEQLGQEKGDFEELNIVGGAVDDGRYAYASGAGRALSGGSFSASVRFM